MVNDRQFHGGLAPLSLVDVDAPGAIRLRCTIAAFGKLDPVDVTVPLQDNDADPDNSQERVSEDDDLVWFKADGADLLPTAALVLAGRGRIRLCREGPG
jgi:hypothetical protein